MFYLLIAAGFDGEAESGRGDRAVRVNDDTQRPSPSWKRFSRVTSCYQQPAHCGNGDAAERRAAVCHVEERAVPLHEPQFTSRLCSGDLHVRVLFNVEAFERFQLFRQGFLPHSCGGRG
jgi:hypothetical protein